LYDRHISFSSEEHRDGPAELARAFITFLQTPPAKAVLKARGLTPL